MKAASLIFLALWLVPSAKALETGVYDLVDPAHPVKFGSDRMTRSELQYFSNDNTRFGIFIHGSQPFPKETYFIAGEKRMQFSDGGSRGSDGEFGASTWGNDPEVAEEFIRVVHPKVQERHHPGHRMLVVFIPDKQEFKAGDPVMVKLKITNVGDSAFAYEQGGSQRGPRDNQFAFTIEGGRVISGPGDQQDMGGICRVVTIKPGESHEIPVDLTKWFDFERGGQYWIRGSYEMKFHDPTVSLAPSSYIYFCLWHDYAAAEFEIRMRK